jgi:hypothetical protein
MAATLGISTNKYINLKCLVLGVNYEKMQTLILKMIEIYSKGSITIIISMRLRIIANFAFAQNLFMEVCRLSWIPGKLLLITLVQYKSSDILEP